MNINNESNHFASPFTKEKDEQKMCRFIKKMRQYPLHKRQFFAKEMREEGEHGISTVKITLFRIFYPTTKMTYSWRIKYELSPTKADIEMDKKMKYVHAYASLFWHLPAEKQQTVLSELEQPLLKDKMKSIASVIIQKLSEEHQRR